MGISSHQNVINKDTKTTTLTTVICTIHALSGMGFAHHSPTASYKEVTSMTSGLRAMQLTPYATHKTYKCKKTRGSPHRLTFGTNKLILEIDIPSKSHQMEVVKVVFQLKHSLHVIVLIGNCNLISMVKIALARASCISASSTRCLLGSFCWSILSCFSRKATKSVHQQIAGKIFSFKTMNCEMTLTQASSQVCKILLVSNSRFIDSSPNIFIQICSKVVHHSMQFFFLS